MSSKFFTVLLIALLVSAFLQAIIGVPAQAATPNTRQCTNLRLLDKNSPPVAVELKGSSIVIQEDGATVVSYGGKSENRVATEVDVHMDKYDFADVLEILGTKIPYQQIDTVKAWDLTLADGKNDSSVLGQSDASIAYIELRTTLGALHKLIQAGDTFGTCD